MMKITLGVGLCCLFIFSEVRADEPVTVPPLPDREGMAGVFTGVSHGVLLVAGGANFPEKKPWEGGKKVWHKTVYAFSKQDGQWQQVGSLPAGLAYGVSITVGDRVFWLGGNDATTHFADAYQVEYRDGRAHFQKLKSLPKSLAYAAGAVVGEYLYVAGGQESPTSSEASDRVWRLNLGKKDADWEALKPIPDGGRILPMASSVDGGFYLVGGAKLVKAIDGTVTREYLKSSLRYHPEKGWQRLADLPTTLLAAPSPMPTDKQGLYLLGGDDGSQVGRFQEKHRGFSDQVYFYRVSTDEWLRSETLKLPRVTAPCVKWGDDWIIPSGEVKPGIRTPDIQIFQPTPPR